MRFGVVTLFPEMVQAVLGTGVVGRAARRGQVAVEMHNPRNFTEDPHRTVDDRPYGGGPGMVMKPAPLVAAIEAAQATMPDAAVVCLSPQGKVFDQQMARRWQQQGSLILVSGRYEGIDERVMQSQIEEEVSIGDFVLSGGELAAMVVIDVVSRLVPGVLGHPQSAASDSFADEGLLDYPHYTRPEVFDGQVVPAVLLSGNHDAIAAWRRRQALMRTRDRRPDLLAKAQLDPSDIEILQHLDTASDASGSQQQ